MLAPFLISPIESLQTHQWFKLICGASYQHIPTIRSCALVYTLAGADCIDISADPAIIATVREAIALARALTPDAMARGYHPSNPWLMVSLNDGEDPHFRKAEFDPTRCPPLCPRPCESICPAGAIDDRGVQDALCYGCGRCLPICPIQQIVTRSYVYAPEIIVPQVMQPPAIDAIELHTQVNRLEDFTRLWRAIKPWVSQLKLLAISCGDGGSEGSSTALHLDYLRAINDLIQPLPCALIWQTDGRPMSGDIGHGTTRACIQLGQTVLSAQLPGYVQLAGGTNAHTVPKLAQLNLLRQGIAGIAYGSYARAILQPYLDRATGSIETNPDLLWAAVHAAHQLIAPLKQFEAPKYWT